MAGLAAGRALRDAGRSVQLLEARERIGGRAWTLHVEDLWFEILGRDEAEYGLDQLKILDLVEEAITPDPGTPYGRIAALEASLYMRNQLLRDTDWASMAHSVEVRTPLVDAALLRQIAPLLIVIRLEEFKYADATAIAVVMLLASFLILLAINRLQRWSELRAGRL